MTKNKLAIALLLYSSNVVLMQHSMAKNTKMGVCYPLNQTADTIIDMNVNHAAILKSNHQNPIGFKDSRFVFMMDNDAALKSALLSHTQMNDLYRQLMAADRLYQQVLALRPPLQSPRYQQARYIKVAMSPIEGNGLAFDEVTANKAKGQVDCHLSIKLKNTLMATNGTPAHELFHVYQNSYFMFKNKWLTEGTARWSESLLRKGTGHKIGKKLPKNQQELSDTMAFSYAASTMWTRLFQLVDNNQYFDIPVTVKLINYLDSQPVIQDNQAYGSTFIKILFEELEVQSNQASYDNNRNQYNWNEKEQRSVKNNIYICKAINNAVNRTLPVIKQTAELKHFLDICLLSSPVKMSSSKNIKDNYNKIYRSA